MSAYSIFNVANVENLSGTSNAGMTLTGNSLNNVLTGANGNDSLNGSSGNDTLFGGLGADTLNGGAGLDSFVFNTAPSAGNVDTVVGFVSADDTFLLSHTIFSGLGTVGAIMDAAAFGLGSAATTAAQRIIYDLASGGVFYDQDGVGGVGQIQIAALGGGTSAVLADFMVL